MKKRTTFADFIKIAALVCLPLLVSGCWSQNNFDQITVVSAIGLDAAPNDQVEVTVQLVNPKLPVAAGGTEQRRPFAMYSAVGDTIYEALDQIRKEAKKNVFMAQTRIVLIGEKLARRGIEDYMDLFWRDSHQNMSSWVLISKQTARHTLQTSKELEDVPADEWGRYFKRRNRASSSAMEMYRFLPRLEQVGYQATSAGISVAPDPDGQSTMMIGKTAVFKGDKLAGWLMDDESLIVSWLQSKIRDGMFEIKLPDGEAKIVAFDLNRIRVQVTPVLSADKLAMRIRVKADADLKMSEKKINLADIRTYAMLETELSEQMKRSFEQTISKVNRAFNSDIIGFGEALHRKYPRQWNKMQNDWNTQLANLDVQVSVSVSIIKSGMKKDVLRK